jgi:spore coat-associated protein N
MNLKKKLLTSTATVAVGALATIGGTFAYFSDTTASANTFTNGTIDVQPNQTYLERFNIVNFKPGDKLIAETDNQEPAMMLNNHGTLPFNLYMKAESPSTTLDAMKDVIVFEKLYFGSESENNLLTRYFPGESEVTLREVLAVLGNGDATVNGSTVAGVGKYIGYLNPQDSDQSTWDHVKGLKYVIKFKDTGVTQNELQGASTGINFSFTALQYNGKDINQGSVDNGSNGTSGGGTFQRNDDITDRANNGSGH